MRREGSTQNRYIVELYYRPPKSETRHPYIVLGGPPVDNLDLAITRYHEDWIDGHPRAHPNLQPDRSKLMEVLKITCKDMGPVVSIFSVDAAWDSLVQKFADKQNNTFGVRTQPRQ